MKVALVGGATSSQMLAPFGDESWEIWTCSTGAVQLPRITKFFELHGHFTWTEMLPELGPYIKWLNAQTFELWAIDNRVFPRAYSFPMQKCVDAFGPFFFTSTAAWMMAKAMIDGAKEIGIFGIDFASNEERQWQRIPFQHFIWTAMTSGIKVSAPLESDILQPAPLYGFSQMTNHGRKLAMRRMELEAEVAKQEADLEQRRDSVMHLRGSLAEIAGYHEPIWAGIK